MRKTVIVLIASTAIACGNDSDNDDQGAGGATQAVAEDGPCATEGAYDCDGMLVVACSEGVWIGVMDCSVAGKTCGTNLDGNVDCIGGASTVDPGGNTDEPTPGESCDVLGHYADVQIGFYDDDLFQFYRVDSYELDNTGTEVLGAVIMYAMPGTPLNTPQSLTGQNSTFSTCSTCVLAQDATGKVYFANEGEVTFTQMGGVGGSLAASLSGVVMREIDINTNQDIAGGDTWCIDAATINAPLMRFPCDLVGIGDGDAVCFTETQIAVCEPATGPQGFSEMHPGDTCSNGQVCVDSTPPGAATCQ
jgi:hypothetical protein